MEKEFRVKLQSIKFEGRLCHVQSLYTSSTSRVCELYSRSNHKAEPEYVCTVKGWIASKHSDSSNVENEVHLKDMKRGEEDFKKINSSNVESGTHSTRGDNGGKDINSSKAESEIHLKDMIMGEDEINVKRTNSPSESAQGLLSRVPSSVETSNQIIEDDCQKLVYSSGEDSWVNVKLNGSLSTEGPCVSLTAPDLDNWHVPLHVDELIQLEDHLLTYSKALATGQGGHENQSVNSDKCSEGKSLVKPNEQHNVYQEFYESEVDLLDHDPWAAITIRLLSLQDKSAVQVDQIVLLVISCPVPEPPTTCQFEQRGANSALLAMFLPSMLQMARGMSDKGSKLLKSENHVQSLCGKQDFPNDPSRGRIENNDIVPDQVTVPCMSTLKDPETVPCPVMTRTDCISSENKELIEPETFEVCVGKSHTDMDMPKVTGGEASHSISDSSQLCITKEFVDKVVVGDLFRTLDGFSERFERLESLCLRMESFLHKNLESFSQRIENLEGSHTNDHEEDGTSNHSITSPDMSIVQIHQGQDQVDAVISLQNGFESIEISSELFASTAMKEPAMKEAVRLNIFDSICADTKDVANEPFSRIHLSGDTEATLNEETILNISDPKAQGIKDLVNEVHFGAKLSNDPEVASTDKGSKDKESVASVRTECASVESALLISSTLINDNESPSTDIVYGESPHSSCGSHSMSTYHSEQVNDKKAVSSSHLEVKSNIYLVNGVKKEAAEVVHEVTDRICGEWMPGAKDPDNFFPSDCINSKSFMTDIADPKGKKTVTEQMIATEKEYLDLAGKLEEQGVLSSSYFGEPDKTGCWEAFELQSTTRILDATPSQDHRLQDAPLTRKFDVFSPVNSNSVSYGEALDDWVAHIGLKIKPSPVSRLSSIGVAGSTSPFSFGKSLGKTSDDYVAIGDSKPRLSSKFPSLQNQDSSFTSISYTKSSSFHDHQSKKSFSFWDEDTPHDSQEKNASHYNVDWQRPISHDAESSASQTTQSDSSFTPDLLDGFFSSEREISYGKKSQASETSKEPFLYNIDAVGGSMPDLLEDNSSYRDGGIYSQYGQCFSQNFDTFSNDLQDSTWPNIFDSNDFKLTDREVGKTSEDMSKSTKRQEYSTRRNLHGVDMTEDLLSWPSLHSNEKMDHLIDTAFPGFDNL
ncbi:hypothetical protein KP509_05G015300 [Ceratopteris richardii]|uniref:Uncharacterized protein n=1 Tax=Ceratopteris richardii TaxID=49495 RepID=A0A8T2ULN3_CERRI|nr:hypothetical protein KP509_05G015300 [Ceratopteris richardii]